MSGIDESKEMLLLHSVFFPLICYPCLFLSLTLSWKGVASRFEATTVQINNGREASSGSRGVGRVDGHVKAVAF